MQPSSPSLAGNMTLKDAANTDVSFFCLCIINSGSVHGHTTPEPISCAPEYYGYDSCNISPTTPCAPDFHECKHMPIVLTVIAISANLYPPSFPVLSAGTQNHSDFLAGKLQCFVFPHLRKSVKKTISVHTSHRASSPSVVKNHRDYDKLGMAHVSSLQLKTVSTAIIIPISLIHTFFESFAKFMPTLL